MAAFLNYRYMSDFSLQLFKFAYFSDYENSIKFLAENLAANEEWDYKGTRQKNYPILKSYLEFTYRKLKQEKKLFSQMIINSLVLIQD